MDPHLPVVGQSLADTSILANRYRQNPEIRLCNRKLCPISGSCRMLFESRLVLIAGSRNKDLEGPSIA
jgi:hypothetical protein